MTETLHDDDATERLRKDDPPAFAAYAGAAMVFAMDQTDPSNVQWWANLGDSQAADGTPFDLETTVTTLAGFVREHQGAPPEALYRFAQAQGLHTGSPDGFADLSVSQRAAFATFTSVLATVDALTAADAALRQSQNPQVPQSEFHDVEDTILAGHGTATDAVPGFGADRVVTVIPAEGTVPGHSAPAKPVPPAIGPDNTQTKATFYPAGTGKSDGADMRAAMPGAVVGPDGSDRSGHGEPGPDAPVAPQAAGPDQGHGGDPTLPFNATGAPPEGQAPAPAALADNAAIAAAPAAPAPAPDAPTNLPAAEETGDDKGQEPSSGMAAAERQTDAGTGAPGAENSVDDPGARPGNQDAGAEAAGNGDGAGAGSADQKPGDQPGSTTGSSAPGEGSVSDAGANVQQADQNSAAAKEAAAQQAPVDRSMGMAGASDTENAGKKDPQSADQARPDDGGGAGNAAQGGADPAVVLPPDADAPDPATIAEGQGVGEGDSDGDDAGGDDDGSGDQAGDATASKPKRRRRKPAA